MGFCPQCRISEPLAETVKGAGRVEPVGVLSGTIADHRPTGIAEVDRVLGGGVVEAATVLLGGEPGVGKSTLLLQLGDGYPGRVLMVSGEESAAQIAMRARRLGTGDLSIAALADTDAIIEHAREMRPDLLLVDSIQTIATRDLDATMGSVGQVRESALRLVRFAKETSTPVVITGHVTKDGSLAGPKLLEHLVDVVLALDGDPDEGLRMLRAQKNRYGSATNVGLFEMTGAGLVAIGAGDALLADWDGSVAGSVAFPAITGRRALLVEVQALVGVRSQARRLVVNGVDPSRVHQLVAVLDRHAGLRLGDHDIYVNVSNGLRVTEPAIDLAIAVALASSITGVPTGRAAAWGEVSLTGAVRPVRQHKRRLEEVAGLGLIALAPAKKTLIAPLLVEAGLMNVKAPSGGVVAFSSNAQPDALVDTGSVAPARSRN